MDPKRNGFNLNILDDVSLGKNSRFEALSDVLGATMQRFLDRNRPRNIMFDIQLFDDIRLLDAPGRPVQSSDHQLLTSSVSAGRLVSLPLTRAHLGAHEQAVSGRDQPWYSRSFTRHLRLRLKAHSGIE